MRSLELFAGAGGLGLGLHAAGFSPQKVVEWDRYCCDTLRENRERASTGVRSWSDITEGDVRSESFARYEGVLDLVSGGPPCQPFSMGGRHRAYDDARDMFPQAIRAVREARPKAFVFENVKGLTRASFRNYFSYVQLQLEHPEVTARPDEGWEDHLARLERHHTSGQRYDLHYRVVTRLLNAADYGVPQKRERVFFVGFRDDLGLEWNFPAPTHTQEALVSDQFRGDYWDRHNIAAPPGAVAPRFLTSLANQSERPNTAPWRTVRDAVADLPDPQTDPKAAKSIPNHKFQPGARAYPGHTGSPLDFPAKTLKAGVHGVPGGENMMVKSDGSVRYFTVRESARLQTFPDDFVFHGSWSETMRQLGNAVPVELAAVVGRSVAALLMPSGRGQLQ
ncbi:MAG: DNA cytosine methyltransferase [Pseudolabrys sp.]|nr:DNA cytosine methyltransferase [Pseudolabrys sp.]